MDRYLTYSTPYLKCVINEPNKSFSLLLDLTVLHYLGMCGIFYEYKLLRKIVRMLSYKPPASEASG